jgi:uracil-DNA glycosylase
MDFNPEEVHSSWRPFFSSQSTLINEIFESLDLETIAPNRSEVFRAFRYPADDIRVLILGQDPYPKPGVADGLAFSSKRAPIPASLRNIFAEYQSDLGFSAPESPDLSTWADRGVLLLNRTLTTSLGERNAHVAKGWSHVTLSVAQYLSEQDIVAILWGNNARELANLFPHRIESAHPSPLSARRGFFGSKPFSRTNSLLIELGRKPIDWKI